MVGGLHKYFKKAEIDKNEWFNIAMDRRMWHDVVENV